MLSVVRFGDFNAFADQANQRIVLPVGLITIMNLLSDAAVMAMTRPELAAKMDPYVHYVADKYNEAVGGAKVRVSDFAEFSHVSPATARRLREDQKFYDLRVAILVDSLALVVGHELGHLVLRHEPSRGISPARSREQEYEADAFGLKLSIDAGFHPFFAIGTVFVMFPLIEGGQDEGHPPTECRVYLLAQAAMRFIADHPEIGAGAGGRVEQLKAQLEQLRKDCDEVGGR